MHKRFIAIAAALLIGAAGNVPSQAHAEPGSWVEMPGAKKPQRPARARNRDNIDFLFGALKVAPDETSAKAIEERITTLWLNSGSDTATLLMTRVKTAVDDKNFDLAVKLLSAIVKIRPDYTEAWNRRATIYYLQKDYERSISDIRQVLAREPRHFGALSGLGLIFQDIGDDKRALDIYRRALEVHPHLPRIPDLVKTLIEKVEGRPI